ncbi:MAG: hypothetical protein OXR73_21825 [Myxococcales bacterium]|nr:hypothetical protein [Myxococcales bacterium]
MPCLHGAWFGATHPRFTLLASAPFIHLAVAVLVLAFDVADFFPRFDRSNTLGPASVGTGSRALLAGVNVTIACLYGTLFTGALVVLARHSGAGDTSARLSRGPFRALGPVGTI